MTRRPVFVMRAAVSPATRAPPLSHRTTIVQSAALGPQPPFSASSTPYPLRFANARSAQMKYLASYLLLQLGGNASPSASDISALLETVGVEAESEQLDKLIAELEGKDINEVSEALGCAQARDGCCGTCVAEKERVFGCAWESSGGSRGRVRSNEAIPDEGCEAWKRDTAEGCRAVCARRGPSLWMELLCHRCTRTRFIPLPPQNSSVRRRIGGSFSDAPTHP